MPSICKQLRTRYHLVNWHRHRYWKWQFIVDSPRTNGDFHRYICLPEGIAVNQKLVPCWNSLTPSPLVPWPKDVLRCVLSLSLSIYIFIYLWHGLMIHIYIYIYKYTWVTYNDLTATSLEITVDTRNHRQMALITEIYHSEYSYQQTNDTHVGAWSSGHPSIFIVGFLYPAFIDSNHFLVLNLGSRGNDPIQKMWIWSSQTRQLPQV